MSRNSLTEGGLNSVVYALYAQAEKRRLGEETAQAGQLLGSVPLVDDPLEIDELAKRPEYFTKNFSLVSALGYSRFNTDGEEWAIRRELTQGSYLAAARSSQREYILQVYQSFLHNCEPEFETIQKSLFDASLTIFFQAFGLVPQIEPTVALLDSVRDVLHRLQLFSWIAPSEAEREQVFGDARSVIAEFTQLLALSEQGEALMKRFSHEARDVESFSPIEEFVMNLFAGVETTVATTGWVLDRLGINPDVQARIHREITDDGKTPFTDCMISETMRYFPPIPFVVRQVAADLSLSRRSFHQGQLVLLSVVGAHHHPDYWSDPHVFDSRRPEFMQDNFDRRAYIPFLTGPRMCGGARLGRLEVQEAIRAIIPRFEMTRENNNVRFEYGLALRPVADPALSVSRRGN